MLRPVLASVPVNDFQEWPPWRGLVVAASSQILDFVGGVLVITVEAGARQWRLDHLDPYEAALPWLATRADVIDTSMMSADAVAHEVVALGLR